MFSHVCELTSELPIPNQITLADYLDNFWLNRIVVRQNSFAFLDDLGGDTGQLAQCVGAG